MLWKTGVIERVPSNFHLSKIIAQKVSYNNSKQNLDNDYFKFFNEQLNLGIIEEIEPTNHKSQIWIPPRPVIRKDPLVLTTKIRPVFNYSLKTKGLPSLNEVAYPGTNIMTDLLALL